MNQSGSCDKKRHLPEMDGEAGGAIIKKEHIKITKKELLKIYLKETEPVKKGESGLTYLPSYRAVLAREGILVRNELGSGSYSKVKRAYCITDYARIVAVKIVNKKLAAKDFLERFLPREMRFWPLIRHPNIIHLHRLFQDELRVYMVLEYAQGGDLLNYVQKQGSKPLEVNLVRKWACQLCEAVCYLHDRDIAHRDLKLENLLLDGSNNIKLTDFGFVKGGSSKKLSSTFCGSRSYAAPEILQGTPYEPKKADVWAVTAIIYIIATGRMPFDETKPTASLLRDQKRLNIWGFDNLSERFACLMKHGFNFDYPLRPSIRQLRANRWFSGSTQSKPTPAINSVYDTEKKAKTSLSETTGMKHYSFL